MADVAAEATDDDGNAMPNKRSRDVALLLFMFHFPLGDASEQRRELAVVRPDVRVTTSEHVPVRAELKENSSGSFSNLQRFSKIESLSDVSLLPVLGQVCTLQDRESDTNLCASEFLPSSWIRQGKCRL
jgi:hypothetical protein